MSRSRCRGLDTVDDTAPVSLNDNRPVSMLRATLGVLYVHCDKYSVLFISSYDLKFRKMKLNMFVQHVSSSRNIIFLLLRFSRSFLTFTIHFYKYICLYAFKHDVHKYCIFKSIPSFGQIPVRIEKTIWAKNSSVWCTETGYHGKYTSLLL